MKLSFRYKFILSFVTLEMIFLVMIVSVNFRTIEETSHKLMSERITYLKTFGSRLLATPVSMYDLATIDMMLGGMMQIEGMRGVRVEDAQKMLLSESGEFDERFIEVASPIIQNDLRVGKVYFWLDFAQEYAQIEKNQKDTLEIILLEILLSIITSYLLGHRLARDLEHLSKLAEHIGEDRAIEIPLRDSSNEINRLFNTMRKMQEKIQDRTQTLQEQQNMIDKYVIISAANLEGEITYVSEAFCQISGYSKEELLGKNHRIIRHPDTPRAFYEQLWATILQQKEWQGEIKNRNKAGEVYWVDAKIAPIYDRFGNHTGYRAIRQDITDKKMVEELSIRDKLTGLYNRLKIDEVFAKAIEEASDGLGVILLDLDHFKKVNDTYGHQVGDEVLKSLARILQTHARSGDTVGRWGGEEFIVIAPKVSIDEASALAQTMRKAIARFAFTKVGHKSASFGVALYQRGDTQESMTYRADKALYEAKAKGRNCVVVSQTKEG